MTRILCIFFTSVLFLNSYGQSSKDYLNLGISKYREQDYKGAIEDYNKAIEADPKYALAYNNRGLAKYKLDDFEGAIKDYGKAIEISSMFTSAYLNRAISEDSLKDYKGAIDDYSKMIELAPMDGNNYYYRAMIKLKLNDKEDNGCLDFHKAAEAGVKKAIEAIKEYCN